MLILAKKVDIFMHAVSCSTLFALQIMGSCFLFNHTLIYELYDFLSVDLALDFSVETSVLEKFGFEECQAMVVCYINYRRIRPQH